MGPVHIGQGAKEQIHRHMIALGAFRWTQAQIAIVHGQVMAWRNHIDLLGLDGHRLGDLMHRQAGSALQDLVKVALVFPRQVHHHHEGHAAVGRQGFEEAQQGLDPPGGSPDSHHRKRQITGGQVLGTVGFGHICLFAHLSAVRKSARNRDRRTCTDPARPSSLSPGKGLPPA